VSRPFASLFVLTFLGGTACTLDGQLKALPGDPTLWAGGGFACLLRDGVYDCRLLDYLTPDFGQAAFPDAGLSFVSLDTFGTCVVTREGEGSCFGGDANHTMEVPAGSWTRIHSGGAQACGLHPDGTAECWGNGSGEGAPPSGAFVDVQAMDGAACVLAADGAITCWGNDYDGNVVSPPGAWSSFILPNSFLCMLDDTGTITCTGRLDLTTTAVPSGAGYHSLTGGYTFACALDAHGQAVCWGEDRAGFLDAPDDEFVQIASGDWFTCGLKQDGDVKCWGCREEASAHPDRYCDWDDPAPWWAPA
jgi:hypothetical protein